VLLQQAQALAHLGLVVRVEHLADGPRAHLAHDGAVVVAPVEGGEVEDLGRLGAPQAQQVHGAHAVAEDGRVDRHAAKDLVRHPAGAQPALVVGRVLGVAADADVVGDLRTPHFPGVAEAQPVVGGLDLGSVADDLGEDAEFVADAVADRRDLESRERIHEAGREPPEAAVAEPRFLLVRDQRVEVDAQPGERPARDLLDAEVEQVVAEERAGQVLGREVADRARVGLLVGAHRAHPVVQQAVADGVGERLVLVVDRGEIENASLHVEQVVQERPADRVLAHAGADALVAGNLQDLAGALTHGGLLPGRIAPRY